MAGRALVDTSAWIDALREDGDRAIGAAVRELAADGEAVLCDLVRVELWSGAGGAAEKKLLRELERELECVPTDERVWEAARNLARACRSKGVTVPATDLVVAACAEAHDLPLIHHDSHFDRIARARGAVRR